MKTSAAGLQFIESFEGRRRLTQYQDVAGKWTIGVGHLLFPGEHYPNGITEEQATELLARDVSKVEEVLNKIAPNLSQNQFDVLSDFGFNLGTGSLAILLSHGMENIPTQILRWDKSGGLPVPGLTRRREAELKLWNS
jgi:lysozyme